jgi:ribonuclease HI
MMSWMSSWKKKGWKNSKNAPVKNADLWKALDELATRHTIKWHWVKGHSGHIENDLVDALANQGIGTI